MSYSINGIGVGNDPSNISRSSVYTNMFNKLGNDSNNIKVIKNFVSSDLCDSIVDSLMPANSSSEQWNDRIYDTHKDLIKDPLGKLIQNQIENDYKTSVEIIQEPFVVKWSEGQSMGYHVDDLGIEDYHITGLIYLNDNYTGGEISFLTQDITIKPSKGDLVMFPGNLHYAHEVKEILSGDRYTMPVWYKFI